MKLRIHLSNVKSGVYSEVRQVLSEFLKDIEYTNNKNANDIVIDCQYINKDNIHLNKAEIIKKVKDEINKRKRNPLRNYI